jgi:hypothetical protein
MLRAWAARSGSAEELTLDPFAALQSRTDLAVLSVPEFVPADSQLGCSVAGGYRWEPPTLIVTQSMSRRRQQFTLLHELGHHLQKTDIALGAAVVDHRDSEAFEDACCDEFAARLLLPEDLVNAHIPGRGPTVDTATALFAASNASRAAICVRLAGRLNSPGAVIVLDDEGMVSFAAARGGLYPPARGSNQSANPLAAAALADLEHSKTISRNDARIWYRDGHSSERLYGQAAWAGERLFLLMVAYSAPWLAMSPPQEGTAQHTTNRWEQCEHCGVSFVIGSICPSCRRPRCPSGHCACTDRAQRICPECFLQKHPSQFASGSEICIDCAG